MSARWARAALGAYRTAGGMIYPFIGGYVRWRAKRGKEDYDRRRERYGHASAERPEGPLVWVHAASVGETAAVIPMIGHLVSLDLNVVLTTGTVTSAQLADERLPQGVIHQYVPLDLKGAVARFLEYWEPDLAIIAESEIWPMTILELGARRIPQVVVNGRLSDRSYDNWRKRSYLSEALMENLAHVVAQSERDAERFIELGARPVTVSGNLKADSPPPPVDEDVLVAYRQQIGSRPTWIAASTHAGEEEIAAKVHAAIKKRIPDLLTIIVPRHPERCDEIEAHLHASGLSSVRRSAKGATIARDTDIFIGDTIGEMGLYFRLAPVAFVGNSLVGVGGGQNPLEPAMLGAAVLSGDKIGNFREAYQKLTDAGAARLVPDAKALAAGVGLLLTQRDRRADMARRGGVVVAEMQGALHRTLEALDPHIRPLVLKAKLNPQGRKDLS